MPSDKTSNLYYVDIKIYKKLIKESIIKDYKLADDNTINHINNEAARILAARNVKKKIPKYVTNEAFITLKDHEQNFPERTEHSKTNKTSSTIKCRIIIHKI